VRDVPQQLRVDPGAAPRLGLSYDDLAERFPQLVVCNISGYGETGPMTDKKAYDLLIQSEAGILSLTGGPGADEMAKVGVSIGDIAAGMYAHSQILAALIARATTGRGTSIDVSMLEALVEWIGYPLYYAYDGQQQPPRAGAAHSTIFPYGPFTAGDGKRVMLGLQNEREWAVFCDQVLGRPELAEDERFASNSARSAARDELTGIIETAFAGLSAAEVVERLEAARIANAQVNDMAGVWSHEQLAARNRWREIPSPAGTLPALLPPGSDRSYEPRMDGIPALGEHSRSILGELGWSAGDIDALADAGTI
jgi:itaconate CoA-transferase